MKEREEGFYKVKVSEIGSTLRFWTIGLYLQLFDNMYIWCFADGDGDEFGSNFTIIEVDENIIMKHRQYDS